MKNNLTESQQIEINHIKNLEARKGNDHYQYELVFKNNFVALRVNEVIDEEAFTVDTYIIGKRGMVERIN